MTRSATPAVQAAVTQSSVGLIVFVEMLFDSGAVRVSSAGYDMLWNGFTWLGTGALGTVEEARETEAGTVTGLAFMLSGVPSAAIALALGETYQGRTVNVYIGWLALPTHGIIADPTLEWSGRIDTMAVVDDAASGAIRVTAENELFDFERPSPIYWSDEDQRKLYPDDTGLRFAKQLTDRALVWPAAEFWRRG